MPRTFLTEHQAADAFDFRARAEGFPDALILDDAGTSAHARAVGAFDQTMVMSRIIGRKVRRYGEKDCAQFIPVLILQVWRNGLEDEPPMVAELRIADCIVTRIDRTVVVVRRADLADRFALQSLVPHRLLYSRPSDDHAFRVAVKTTRWLSY